MTLNCTIRPRRQHSAEFKSRLIAICQQPGISVSAVALAHGLNANLLRRWIRQYSGSVANFPVAMVPIRVDAPVDQVEDAIQLDIQRGTIRINIRWPLAGAESCARLLGAWLK